MSARHDGAGGPSSVEASWVGDYPSEKRNAMERLGESMKSRASLLGRTILLGLLLLSAPAHALTCDTPTTLATAPFVRKTTACTLTPAEIKSLFSSPLELVAGQTDVMLAPVLAAWSKPSGGNYTTAGVTGMRITWGDSIGAAGFSSPGAQLFLDDNAASVAVLNSNNIGGPYAWLAARTVAGLPLKANTTGANISGADSVDLKIVLEWLEIPLEF